MEFKHFCELCGYKENRKDNFDRHVREHHKKELKTCVCGKQMTASGLSRHKHGCSVALSQANRNGSNASNNLSTAEIESGDSVGVALSQANRNGSDAPNNLVTNEIESGDCGVQQYKIETTIQVVTSSDGNISIIQNEIKVGDHSLLIVPASCVQNGKFCSE